MYEYVSTIHREQFSFVLWVNEQKKNGLIVLLKKETLPTFIIMETLRAKRIAYILFTSSSSHIWASLLSYYVFSSSLMLICHILFLGNICCSCTCWPKYLFHYLLLQLIQRTVKHIFLVLCCLSLIFNLK